MQAATVARTAVTIAERLPFLLGSLSRCPTLFMVIAIIAKILFYV
jgi:hypothetical protein